MSKKQLILKMIDQDGLECSDYRIDFDNVDELGTMADDEQGYIWDWIVSTVKENELN